MAASSITWKPPPWAWLAAGGLVGTGGGWTITRSEESQQDATSAACEELQRSAEDCAAVIDLLLDQIRECQDGE